jgi:drug/metabolite transporter (DMT)-like permease
MTIQFPSLNPKTRFWIGVLILIFANIGFSAKAVIIKLMYVYQVDTPSVIALRMLFSLPVYLIVAVVLARRADNVPMSGRALLMVGGLGILSYYVSSMLDFLGLQYVSAGVERLILFTYPTMVLLLSAAILKKKINPPQYLALFLTYLGVALAFTAEQGLGAQKNLWLGGSLIFTCAFTYAVFTFGTGQLVHRFGSVKFTAYAMIAATIPALIQSAIYNGFDIFRFPMPVYGLVAWLVLVATVIPTFLIIEGIRLVGSGNAAIIGFVGPVATIFMANALLGETLSFRQLLGTAIVLAGVFLITWQGGRQGNS